MFHGYFPNLDYYLSLFENKYLRIGNCIRTSDRGTIDEFYQIIDERGNLRGITEIPTHQGMKGIFSPEEILIVKGFPQIGVFIIKPLEKTFVSTNEIFKKENYRIKL